MRLLGDGTGMPIVLITMALPPIIIGLIIALLFLSVIIALGVLETILTRDPIISVGIGFLDPAGVGDAVSKLFDTGRDWVSSAYPTYPVRITLSILFIAAGVSAVGHAGPLRCSKPMQCALRTGSLAASP